MFGFIDDAGPTLNLTWSRGDSTPSRCKARIRVCNGSPHVKLLGSRFFVHNDVGGLFFCPTGEGTFAILNDVLGTGPGPIATEVCFHVRT